MKIKAIKFFTPEENISKAKPVEKSMHVPTGHISGLGKLVFPAVTLRELKIEPDATHFKIGVQEGKKKIKSIYLLPSERTDQTFSFEKSGRGHVISLGTILKNGGINFDSGKLIFKVLPFDFDTSIKGYELAIETDTRQSRYIQAAPEGGSHVHKPPNAE